jgi:hypothetical protein
MLNVLFPSLPAAPFHGRDFSHIRDRRFFEGHGFTLGAALAHGVLSTDSCASRVSQECARLCVCFPTTRVSTPYYHKND